MTHRVMSLLSIVIWCLGNVAMLNSARADDINVPVDEPDIQAAIDAANNGDAVILADGTYTGPGNFDIDFHGKAIIVRSASGPDACIVDCQQSGRGFIFQSGETDQARLEGVTITHAFVADSGAAIYIVNDSSPTIMNCILADNKTDSVFGGRGAGIYVVGGSPTVVDCVIRDNWANEAMGGGIANTGTLNLLRCEISHNMALTDGIGGGLWNSGTVIARRCVFADNSGFSGYAEGRGGAVFNQGTARLIDCTFERNIVFQETPLGGAIYNSPDGTLLVRRCTFESNGADGSGDTDPIFGGAIYTRGSTTIIDSAFKKNIADIGGAILVNGGEVLCSLCRFEGNVANQGGAIAMFDGSLTVVNGRFFVNRGIGPGGGGGAMSVTGDTALVNCLFAGNAATHDFGFGGALRISGTATITNCTLAANVSGNEGGGIVLDQNSALMLSNSILWANRDSGPLDQSAQIFNLGGTIAINRSCVRGLDGSLGGIGNIADNPRFVNANGPDGVAGTPDDDLRLQKQSPCVNTGSKSSLPADVADLDNDNNLTERLPLDLALRKRIFGPRTDMGAFEFRP